MNIRWIVGIVMFFLMCTLISNIIERQNAYTTLQIANIQAMQGQQFTEAKEPDLGGVVTAGENPLNVITAIWQALKLEYSFLHDIDRSITTEAECRATYSNGRWNSTDSVCQVPNAWWILWLIMIYGPMVAISFYFALQLWKAISGRG